MQIANCECKFGKFKIKNYAIIKSSVVIKRNLFKWFFTVDTKCRNFELRIDILLLYIRKKKKCYFIIVE